MKNLRTVLFQIRGADFLCIPFFSIENVRKMYKLCWVKKISDNIHTISFEYEVMCYAESISEAKERAKCLLEYFS